VESSESHARPGTLPDDDLFSDVLSRQPPTWDPLDDMPAQAFEEGPDLAQADDKAHDENALARVLSQSTMRNTVKNSGGGERALQDDKRNRDARAQLLEQQVRKKFTALLKQFDKGENPDIERELSRLILEGSGFSWKQKFMFAEIGFALRRRRLYKLALASHIRALDISPVDEHALFNVARAQYDLGNVEEAKIYLHKALESAPDFEAGRRFLAFLSESGNSRD
jgi:tetratricopeptide (TPR) repeat protein